MGNLGGNLEGPCSKSFSPPLPMMAGLKRRHRGRAYANCRLCSHGRRVKTMGRSLELRHDMWIWVFFSFA